MIARYVKERQRGTTCPDACSKELTAWSQGDDLEPGSCRVPERLLWDGQKTSTRPLPCDFVPWRCFLVFSCGETSSKRTKDYFGFCVKPTASLKTTETTPYFERKSFLAPKTENWGRTRNRSITILSSSWGVRGCLVEYPCCTITDRHGKLVDNLWDVVKRAESQLVERRFYAPKGIQRGQFWQSPSFRGHLVLLVDNPFPANPFCGPLQHVGMPLEAGSSKDYEWKSADGPPLILISERLEVSQLLLGKQKFLLRTCLLGGWLMQADFGGTCLGPWADGLWPWQMKQDKLRWLRRTISMKSSLACCQRHSWQWPCCFLQQGSSRKITCLKSTCRSFSPFIPPFSRITPKTLHTAPPMPTTTPALHGPNGPSSAAMHRHSLGPDNVLLFLRGEFLIERYSWSPTQMDRGQRIRGLEQSQSTRAWEITAQTFAEISLTHSLTLSLSLFLFLFFSSLSLSSSFFSLSCTHVYSNTPAPNTQTTHSCNRTHTHPKGPPLPNMCKCLARPQKLLKPGLFCLFKRHRPGGGQHVNLPAYHWQRNRFQIHSKGPDSVLQL